MEGGGVDVGPQAEEPGEGDAVEGEVLRGDEGGHFCGGVGVGGYEYRVRWFGDVIEENGSEMLVGEMQRGLEIYAAQTCGF